MAIFQKIPHSVTVSASLIANRAVVNKNGGINSSKLDFFTFMRNIVFIFLSGIILIANGCGSELAPDPSLSGQLTGTNAIAVTRVTDLNRKQADVVAKTNVGSDGSFEIPFKDQETGLYELNFPNGKKFQFVGDGRSSLAFKGSAQDPDAIVVTGSEGTETLRAYERFRKESLERLVLSVRRQLEEMSPQGGPEFERLGRLEVTNYEKHKLELLDFVKKNMGTSPAVYATSVRWPSDAALIEPVVAAFEKAHPDLEITKRLKEKLAVIRQTSVGGNVPDINMRDETGKEISLYGVTGKYTLIDFWGSWCGPCRREAETLSGLYAEYKSKGFEIYGVALESEMQLWKNAKALDRRTWPNVLSLREFETDAAYDFAVTSLPANFLIDENGKVVAKDLHGEELREKLSELLGGN